MERDGGLEEKERERLLMILTHPNHYQTSNPSSHIQTILSFPRTYKPSPLPQIPIILTHIYTNHPHTSKPYSHIQHILSFPRTYKPSSLPHIPIILTHTNHPTHPNHYSHIQHILSFPHTYKPSPLAHIQIILTHTNHQDSRNFRESPEMGHDLQVSRKCYKISRNLANLINLIFFSKKSMLLL